VIGSVYAGRLLQAGHQVVMLARGQRLADLRAYGLVLEDTQSGHRAKLPVSAVAEPGPAERYDLVLVPVQRR
jgi:2-dehydropantoate 2-reductase